MGVYSLDCGSQSSVKFRYGSFSGRDYRLLGLRRPKIHRYARLSDSPLCLLYKLAVMIGEKVRGVGYAGQPDTRFRSLWASLAILTLWTSFSGRAERESTKNWEKLEM